MLISILNTFFTFLGLLLIPTWFVGFFWSLRLATKESLVQGLIFLFFPPYGIYYVITRWEKCKKPGMLFIGGFLGIILVLLGFSALQLLV